MTPQATPTKQHLQLELERCPHCAVARPLLILKSHLTTANHAGQGHRDWGIYACRTCGGVVTAAFRPGTNNRTEMYPEQTAIPPSIPERARTYLAQAFESIHAPAGAVMLTASAVDAMLKAKGLTEGTLYARIDRAAVEHLITREMALWAHEVRLEANDQRHADEGAPLPSPDDAHRCIAFAQALAEFLFVLPARVAEGRKEQVAPT